MSGLNRDCWYITAVTASASPWLTVSAANLVSNYWWVEFPNLAHMIREDKRGNHVPTGMECTSELHGHQTDEPIMQIAGAPMAALQSTDWMCAKQRKTETNAEKWLLLG